MNQYPHLFSPLTVGKITFKNRILAAPNMMLKMENGAPLDDFFGYTEAKAKGGAAQVTVGDNPCDIETLLALPDPMISDSREFNILIELVNVIKKHGSVSSIELIHAGDVAEPFMEMRMLGSKIPMGPCGYTKESGSVVKEMDEAMIEKIIEDSARTAAIYKRSGFDMLLIQGGHMWLLNQFLSPVWNKRTDRFGGSLENRARFPIMMIERIREKIGRDMLIEYRLSGSDLIEGGNEVEDIIKFVKMVKDKIDIVHVSSGSRLLPGVGQTGLTCFGPYGNNVYLAEKIKKSTKLPVTVVGNILDPEFSERIIAEGKVDFVSMARALIADPDLPNKAAAGRSDEIIPCLRCFACMLGETEGSGRHTGFECAVNPGTARRLEDKPIERIKNILVAGGGVAGITAALTADGRGHKVTLIEKSEALGGILKFTETDTIKVDLKRYLRYLLDRVAASKINVLLNTEVSPESVKAKSPEVIFVASGSEPIVPKISGIEAAISAMDVYQHPEKVGQRVAVIGGGLTGCETSIHLANLGKAVTIIELTGTIAAEANPLHLGGVMSAMAKKKVAYKTELICTRIKPDGIEARDKAGNGIFIAADTVIYAVGMKPVTHVYEDLKSLAQAVTCIGDCAHVGKIMNAVYDGFFAGYSI